MILFFSIEYDFTLQNFLNDDPSNILFNDKLHILGIL